MRKSFIVLSVLALIIIGADIKLFNSAPLPFSISYASAEETLQEAIATSTLETAPVSVWEAPESKPAIEPSAPQPHAASVQAVQKAAPVVKKSYVAEAPVRLIIPSIGLDTQIVGVGLNAKGEMDVPSGNTSNVGWYSGGPKPGQRGSAVLDAHVFAAFDDLRYLKVGSDIIVVTESGQKLRFIVRESTVFKLGELTSDILFGRGGDRWLNLITCAGQLTPDHSTYDHRLIVYSSFVEVL